MIHVNINPKQSSRMKSDGIKILRNMTCIEACTGNIHNNKDDSKKLGISKEFMLQNDVSKTKGRCVI